MTKPLDRARQLIAKAVDPAVTEEEARTIALIACRLIAEHKLLEAPADPLPPPPPPWPPHHAPPPWPPRGRPPPVDPDPLEAFWEVFTRATGMPGAPFPGRRPGAAPGPAPGGPRSTAGSGRASGSPFRHVDPTYPPPHTPRESPWQDRLPCELWIYADRPCEVCGKTCESGELVWAFEMAPADYLGGLRSRPRVAHLRGCRDKLPRHQRQPGPR